VVARSIPQTQKHPRVDRLSEIDELSGRLRKQDEKDKLMNSVLEADKDTIDDGKLIKDALNQSMSSFTPDLFFEKLVKDYKMAKKIIGPHLLRELTGYDEEYLDRNVNIPEFQRGLKKKMEERIKNLKGKKLLDRSNTITDQGMYLASLVLYTEELDRLMPKGIIGEKINKKSSIHGDKNEIVDYKKGDLYRNIAVRRTVKNAIRRGRTELDEKDLKVYTRQAKGQLYMIYALDASGSMKGRKIDSCKKAGVALAFKAIDEKDKVGLLIFGKDVKTAIPPSQDFLLLLSEITRIKASKETDIAKTIRKSIELFPSEDVTKHLLLITDAVPTTGEDPKEDTLKAAEEANSSGITISVVGINLDKNGTDLAKRIVEVGQGKLYVCRDPENIDTIVLEDYAEVA
jgi:magnesium chelatase subunit I